MSKLWFKGKRYGYGWIPSSWEGWLSLCVFIIGIFMYVRAVIDKQLNGDYGAPWWYHATFLLFVALFLLLCFKKGEKLRWRWGK